MADSKKTKDPKDDGKKKKSLGKKLLVLFLILAVLAAIAIPAYLLFMSKKPAKIQTSTLPVEIIAFCFEKLPDLYATFLSLDEEIRLTQKEIKRIQMVGETYPEQKKIADAELKGWTSNLNTLTKIMTDFEKELQVFYVSYRVNTETGQTLMDEKKEALKQNVEAVIAQSKTLTDKLRAINEAKSFFEKTRDRLFNK
jgi:flagellar basal body-associated protein FliL